MSALAGGLSRLACLSERVSDGAHVDAWDAQSSSNPHPRLLMMIDDVIGLVEAGDGQMPRIEIPD